MFSIYSGKNFNRTFKSRKKLSICFLKITKLVIKLPTYLIKSNKIVFYIYQIYFLLFYYSETPLSKMEKGLHERDVVGLQDMVLLEDYHSESAFIDNLRKRYQSNLIYVSIKSSLQYHF